MNNIFIFKGIKMLGTRDHTGQWWKVVQDCVQCGKCCMDVPPTWVFPRDKSGACIYLEMDAFNNVYFCSLADKRPITCCENSPFSTVEYCSVKLEKIDDPNCLL